MVTVKHLGFSIVILIVFFQCVHGETVQEILDNTPVLSRFKAEITKATAQDASITANLVSAKVIFAPINSAWDLIGTVPDKDAPMVIRNHLVTDSLLIWAALEAMGSGVNTTKLTAIGGNKALLLHKEHGDFFVSGAMFVTKNFTDPAVNEISKVDGKRFYFIDRVINREGHKDSFYDHMDKDQAEASAFAGLVKHYETNGGPEGKAFANKMKNGMGTLFVPRAAVLNQALVKSELETLKNNRVELGRVLLSHYIDKNFVFIRYLHENIPWITMGDPFTSHAADPVKHPDVYRFIEGGGVKAELKDDGANITMSNGVMHIIDALLHYKFTVYTMLGTNKIIGGDYLKSILLIPEVMETVKTATVTVFAPTHLALSSSEHFNKVVSDISSVASDADKNASRLAKLLKSAMVGEALTYEKLKGGVDVTTMNGTRLISKKVGNDVFVTVDGIQARILPSESDINARNGIIHVVDGILALKGTNLWEKMTQTNFKVQLSRFNQLVQDTKMDVIIADPNRRVAVFAPVDEAFDKAAKTFAQDQVPTFDQFLKEDKYAQGRIAFVKRHIVTNRTRITSGSDGLTLQTLNPSDQIRVDQIGDGTGALRLSFRSVFGKFMIPIPATEADNGYLYRIQDGVLYYKDDVKIGATTGAGGLSSSVCLSLIGLLLATLLQL